MTCIIGMVKGDHIFMAGDLLGSNGFTKRTYPDSKVFVNGDFIIGYTSSFRMGQLLQYNWTQPPRLEELTDREYLQIDVIESMKDCFSGCGYGTKAAGGDSGGNFLIGYKGCLYEMQEDFSLLKSEDFISVGSGCYHAESAMSILVESGLPPDMILAKAISVAARFTTCVSEECTIVTTDKEFEFSYKEDTPSEENLRDMSHKQLLSFMFDDNYDESEWDTEDTSEAVEKEVQEEDLNHRAVALRKLEQCDGWNLADEITYATFDGYCISSEGLLTQDNGVYGIIHVANKPDQVNLSVKVIKTIAGKLGVEFSPKASGTKVAALIIKFMKEVVDILNS